MNRRHLALFVLLCALWGFSFVALKVALRHVDPIFLGSIRYWLPGFLLVGFCAVIRRPVLPARRDLPALALLGLVNTGLLTLFLNLGQKEISAALGSILLYTYPLMAAIVSPLFLGERIDRWKIGGIGFGFVGILLVAGLGGHASAAGVTYVLLAAASWAAGTVIFKKMIPGKDVFTVTAWQLLFGALFLSVLSAAVEGAPHADFTGQVWLAFLWMTIPGMAVAGTLWYWLLERGDAAVASAYMFMTPVFGVFFGWVVLGEHVTWTQLAGGLLVAASIYLVNRTLPPPVEAGLHGAPAASARSGRGTEGSAGDARSSATHPRG